MSITPRPFGVTRGGEPVTCWRLENAVGAWAEVLDYGGTLRAVCVPDRAGALTDVCLGYDTLAEYEDRDGCLGALVGRCANRIAGGRFTLGGRDYALAMNSGPNHLHGGLRGFDRRVWRGAVRGETLALAYTSPHGEEGYPGTVEVWAEYSLTDENELILRLFAQSDANTVVNLTNHAYWNLDGHGAGDVGGHTLQIEADAIAETDDSSCPTGALYPVAGTPFALQFPRRLDEGWDREDPQMAIGRGYDHHFILPGGGLRRAAVLTGAGGLTLTLSTTQPGVQVYTANWLTQRPGKGGAVYGRRCGVALEAQGVPNAVNLPQFPTVVLGPGERYAQEIRFGFS